MAGNLQAVVTQTLEDFSPTFIDTLPGGSESYLALTQGGDGTRCVVKVMMPNDHGMAAELAGLQAAKGRGYAKLIGANPKRGVLVIEELGAPIADSGLPIQQQLQHITQALKLSWQAEIDPSALVHGANKADWLYHHIQHTPSKGDRTCGEDADPHSLDHIDLRRSQWRQDAFVLVHGDAHEYNTLAKGLPNRRTTNWSIQTVCSLKRRTTWVFCCATGSTPIEPLNPPLL